MARRLIRSVPNYFTVDASPTSSGVLTMCCFAKWSGTTGGAFGDQRVLALGNSGNDDIRMSLILNEGTPGWRYQSVNAGNQALITGSAINSGQWYHVAGVRASATSHKLYQNGSLVSSDTTNVTSPTAGRFRIGQYPTSSYNQSFDGDVAEVAIWSTDLTAGEVKALARGRSPLKVRPANLVFYSPLNRIGDEFDQVGRLLLTQSGVPLRSAHPYVEPPKPKQPRRYKAAGGGSIACAVTAAGSVAANLRGAGAFACAAAGAGSVTADLKGAGAMACAISGTSTVAAAANQSWTLSHSDDFTGSSSDIDGRTMSDGLGAWSKRSGASPIAISSNEAVGPGGGTTVYYDSAASVIDGQRSGLTVRTLDGPGPMVRVQSDGSGYLAYPRSSASFNVYRWNGTSLTSIASSSDSFAVGDVCMIEANGTAIKAFKNGVEIASVTDATYATGRPGVYADNASHFDNWNSYVPSVAASSIACSISGTGSATADLRGAGAMACVVAASGSVAANLRGAGALAMAASGTGSVAANLKGAGAVACAISGTSSVTATLTAPAGSVSCAITGSGTVAAALAGAGALSMACAAVATVTATWSAVASIRATITASAAVSCSVGDFASLTVDGPPRIREGHATKLEEGQASVLREGHATRLREWP